MAEGSRAVAALLFHVVVFGQRWYSGAGAAYLPVFLEDDFGAPVVLLDLAVNINHPALQLPHIPHAFQVTGKDHHGEGAKLEVVAEVQKVNSPRALLDSDDFASNAL